ncbi:hypothetical protein J3F84DRAFT_396292 [Trichoderma pleuroticola]
MLDDKPSSRSANVDIPVQVLKSHLPNGIKHISSEKIDHRTDEEIAASLQKRHPVTSDKNIWGFWHTGFAQMRPWSQRNVINWVRRLGPDWTVHIVDCVNGSETNVFHYAEESFFPKTFIDGTMDGHKAHMGDLVRLPLLWKYGGIWMDVGLLLLRHVDDICWKRIEDPASPYELSALALMHLPDTYTPLNGFLATKRNNPFIKRWHDIYVALWTEGVTNATGFHKHPLLRHLPIFRPQVKSPALKSIKMDYEKFSDYVAHYMCAERLRKLIDPNDGFNGAEWYEKHMLLFDAKDEMFQVQTLTDWDAQLQFRLFSLPRSGAGAVVDKSWHEAEALVTSLLANTSMENSNKDNEKGSFAAYLRYGSTHFDQTREVKKLEWQNPEEEVITIGYLEPVEMQQRGLGALICKKFAEEGANVAINYVSNADAAQKVADSLKEYPVKTFVIQGDAGKREDNVRLVQETVKNLGGLDIIVANAGWTKMSRFGDLHALNDEEWNKCWAVNVMSHLQLVQEATPIFNANPEGGVYLITSSVAGTTQAGSSMAYSVTKAAGLHLMKNLAYTQGPKIRINAILPGLLLTEWTDLDDCADVFITVAKNTSMTGQQIAIVGSINVNTIYARYTQCNSTIMASSETEVTHTIASLYDAIGVKYEKAFADIPARQKSLDWLLSHLPRTGCKILDIGCGTGCPVALVLSSAPHNHLVHGIDASKAMLAIARQSVPSATFQLIDAREFEAEEASYNAVTSYFALLMDISHDEIRETIQKVFTWLKPGGFFILATIPVDLELASEKWLGKRALLTSMSEEHYVTALQQVGFVIEFSEVENFMPKAVEAGICDEDNVVEEAQLFIYARKP